MATTICSKRLFLFLSELIKSMERHGHLAPREGVCSKLLTISPTTMDLLSNEPSCARHLGDWPGSSGARRSRPGCSGSRKRERRAQADSIRAPQSPQF